MLCEKTKQLYEKHFYIIYNYSIPERFLNNKPQPPDQEG